MRQLISFFMVLALSISVAEAAKFGSGKSFGFKKPIQYRALNQQKTQKQTAPAKQAAPNTTGKRRSGMGGILGGMLAGGLLAALFFGGAFEGMAPGDWLLIALLAGGLWFFLRHRARQRQAAYAGAVHEDMPIQQRQGTDRPVVIGAKVASSQHAAEAQDALLATPAWFDPESFAASAVENFLAVQKAWDAGDMETLKSYCASACFAEIAHEIKAGEHHTEVEDVHAEIIDWDYDNDQFVVSIRFSGFVKENGGLAKGFTEVWHLAKPQDGQGTWKIVGVQQL